MIPRLLGVKCYVDDFSNTDVWFLSYDSYSYLGR